MPIQVNCSQCGKGLKAPDALAGKKAKCPACGSVVDVPHEEILDAELADPAPLAPAPSYPAADLSNLLEEDTAYQLENPQPNAGQTPAESRRPCPACGEMIVSTAAKCRFCGEIFDATLKRKAKKGSATDEDMTTGDWVVAVLCPGIGCIAGIVWLIMGKQKAGKMIGVSVGMNVVWLILRTVLEVALQHGH